MLESVVLDIEGTTSATTFVTGRLYPYASQRFPRLLRERADDTDVKRAVAQVRERIGEPDAGVDRIVAALLDWVAADEKVSALKTLQGKIWAAGFASGELVSHFYPDVIPVLRRWSAAGHRLSVFSSGSVAAQQAWFGHSAEGDLRPLVGAYFDTETAGPKRESSSYRRIAAALEQEPGRIVFLSDVVAELDAAREAGWQTVGVRRPGEPHYERGVGGHREVHTLTDVDLS